jgi:deazaflavin-dependent oxidoreductase (nitroreductase family)
MTFEEFAGEPYCYLTITGRTSGEPREIEIWFGTVGPCLYLMAGGRESAHWVRNLRKQPKAKVRISNRHFRIRGRKVTDPAEDALARRLLLEKYSPGYTGDLASWGRSALPIALDPIEEG